MDAKAPLRVVPLSVGGKVPSETPEEAQKEGTREASKEAQPGVSSVSPFGPLSGEPTGRPGRGTKRPREDQGGGKEGGKKREQEARKGRK